MGGGVLLYTHDGVTADSSHGGGLERRDSDAGVSLLKVSAGSPW